MLRRRWAATATAGVLVMGLWLGGSVGSAATGAHAARKARKFTETASVHLVKKSGSILKERGTATGTLPGTVTARFNVSNIAKVTGSVTFYPNSGGSLTFSVVGYPQSTGQIAKFTGYMATRRGKGRYASAVGSGTFTGTVNRKTWAMTVHAHATLTY